MSNKVVQPPEPPAPESIGTTDATPEKEEQETFMLESKYLEHHVYSRDSERLLARFHHGRAEVRKKELQALMKLPAWGKDFGHVGMLRNAATNRPVEVEVR